MDDAVEAGVVLVGAAALYVAAETCTPGSACERAASAGLDWIGDKASAVWNHIVHNESAPKTGEPDRTANDELRWDPKSGAPQPDPEAEGTAHSQLGTRNNSKSQPGKTFPNAQEFDDEGKPVREINFTDHGMPNEHPNPHQHVRGPEKNPGAGRPKGPPTPLPDGAAGPRRPKWWVF